MPAGRREARAQEAPPNILVFMTDDQRAYGMLQVMPFLRSYFKSGVEFSNAVATTPLCCPSRASVFTGRYAHNHGVRSNARQDTKELDHETTAQYYLNQAGYRTGLFGKFLNGWPITTRAPYFDEYAFMKPGYFTEWGIGKDGIHEAKIIDAYSTHFIERKAVSFLEGTEVIDEQPWLLFVTPYAPHDPAIPPARYEYAPVPKFRPDPAMTEIDLSDKPDHLTRYIQPFDESHFRRRRAKQLRTLMAADDLFRSVIETMEAGEESNTLVVFMSDNGYMWGEHGLRRKGLPYQPSIRIPLMMRWDGYLIPGVDERLSATIDIGPTILDAANVSPTHDVDGRSLLELWDREELLAEVFAYRARPDLWWASVVSRDYQYVEYYGSDETVPASREYYDLLSDPYQLDNLFGDSDPLNDPDFTELSTRLASYRTCPRLSPCP